MASHYVIYDYLHDTFCFPSRVSVIVSHRVKVFCICMYDTPLRRIIPCELMGHQSHNATICLKLLLISGSYRENNILTHWGPRQNGRHFADDIFKCIFFNENFLILNKISLKYVPWGLIDNMAALAQLMAWHRIGDKPLSVPMLVCFTYAYMRHSAALSFKQESEEIREAIRQWFLLVTAPLVKTIGESLGQISSTNAISLFVTSHHTQYKRTVCP